jgi:antibiotic biosynthesis monooxygenase (ABM) superfamily enzyme
MQSTPNIDQSDLNSGVFFVVRHLVKHGMDEEYEQWLKRLMFKAAEFPGHLGVQVIKPLKGNKEFAIAVRFHSIQAAKDWQNSSTRKKIAAESSKYLSQQEQFEIHSGIDFWFTPSSLGPPRWKQWLLTTLVIWPLSVIIPLGLMPIFDYYQITNTFTIYQAISAFLIVGIATYWAMPWCTTLFYKWLYPR